MSLVLFDIDGTLLLSGGAGMRGMSVAFERVFGVPQGFASIDASGYTDTYLLSRALAQAGLPDTPAAHTAFRSVYLDVLTAEILLPGTGRRGLMPGVADLLGTLAPMEGLHLGLLTGNYSGAAEIKLKHYGIAGYFSWGAFGEEAVDRNDLAGIALTRACERAVPEDACARAVVIGDTPRDIACAHAVGARAFAVATGSYSVDQLREAGADFVFADLSDTGTVIQCLAGGSAWESNPACPRRGSDRF